MKGSEGSRGKMSIVGGREIAQNKGEKTVKTFIDSLIIKLGWGGSTYR